MESYVRLYGLCGGGGLCKAVLGHVIVISDSICEGVCLHVGECA